MVEQLLAYLVLEAHIATHRLHEHLVGILIDYHLAIVDLDEVLFWWHLLHIALGASTLRCTNQLSFLN